jgi:PAS domain S-box-containing protein
MTERSEYVLETLREGQEFTLYRGRQRGNPSPVLAVALAAERPSPQSQRRLEHEYSLAAELDPKWATRPLALTRHEGRTMLVLEDPGGEPLDGVLARGRGQPLELTRFLRLTPSLASALGQVHRRGMIHKDIKPANVFVDNVGNVRLTGFGIASRLPHERQAPAPPEVTAGTLAYMAPEQTGRMNRSIDSRSDLYSLGITFYEMLTGTLPFSAVDPMEWIHCHIARRPVPPSERVSGVPVQLSAIVMKLLAKAAEERYQTAAGLEADLHRCLREWETRRRIDLFPLGVHDVSDRLLIPEKLYGREREIDALLASFDRVVANGRPELVLVSGYSGVGKSSVVNELHKGLVAPRGLFASGKFDQYKRDIPYTTLAQAFQTLIRQILAKSEAEVAQWREALTEAVGQNGQLIVNLIPEVEFVIGKQPPVPDLPPQDEQNRFQMVFRRFLGAFAQPEHPLALFLDDLQWLDAATLELLEHLVCDPNVRHLMLVGAYRDNEVSSSHPLLRTLGAIRKAGAVTQEIVLAPLGLDDVGRLVAAALHCERDAAHPLAQLVHEKTGGNPFFAIQFLMALAEEGMLAFDPEAAAWIWDLARIRAKGYTDNVVHLMVRKLRRLPDSTQEALKQLACLGNAVEIATLTLVHGESEEEIHTALWEAARTGLILRQEGSYAFLHDRVQEAAYALIPEGERAAAHLRIGRVLASLTAAAELEERIFEIVNQLNRGAALIDLREERERVAELNLIAGKRAKTSTAYASAMNYLAAGHALLAEDSWERRYELTFLLEYHRAACELLTADLVAAEERLTMLSSRAEKLVDIAAVACLRLTLYTTLDRSDRGVEVCLEFLHRGGVHWSPHPTKDDVRREYEQIWSQVGSRSIEELVDLPLMSDSESRATLDVLTEVVTPALFTDENLLSLVICRMANLSLEHGNSDGSCFAYVWLGMILGPHFGDYRAGFRFGRLGYDLVEKRGLHRFQARAYMSFGNLVIPWTRHIQSGRVLVRRAFDAANEIGDLTFAAYSCNNLNTNLLATGDPLGDVQREAENGLEFARKARFGLVIDIIIGQLRFIRTLRGLTPRFSSFNDPEFDESRFEHHLQSDPRLALPECWYWIRKLQARVYAGEYAAAIEAASNARRLLWTSPSFFEVAEYHFYDALARAGQYEAASADERPQHLEALAAHHKQLAVWAENCNDNFQNRAALVRAEIARIEGGDVEAMRLYEEAIRSARQHGFVQNEALAHEVAARFYLARGFETIAHAYLRNARNCYDRWGALGKLKQLDERYPHLHEERASTSPTATIGALVGQLDVETVVKASQALSSEIVLRKLIEKLMRIAVEHAGADRGLLILFRGDEPQIEAEATTGYGRVEVNLRRAAVTPSDLPQSALHYVIRTRERVVLDDALTSSSYSDDEYVRQKHPRSVLCVPIVKQAKLVGALYLENNLTPCAFTPGRIAVLELLASQAAISLENARLYSDLQRSEAFLSEGQSISSTGSFGWNVLSGEIYWSEETYKIFEHNRATKPTLESVLQRFHPDDRDLVRQTLDRASREGTNFDFEHRLLMPDGRVQHIHFIAHAMQNSSGNLEFVGAVTDVTDRKEAEEAVQRSEKRFRAMIDYSSDGIVLDGLAKGLIYVSPSTERVLGYPPEEFARLLVHPDHIQRNEATWAEVIQEPGKVVTHEALLRHKDGSWRWIERTLSNLLHEPSVQAVVMNFRDITVRKNAEAEKERLEIQLRQSQKMEAMGTLAGGIAHDFNNILGAILGYGELAQKDASEGSAVRRYLDNVMHAGGRAKSLVDRILAFSRSGVGERGPVNVQAVIEEALELIATLLAPGVSLDKRLEAGDAAIVGDATQLHQVAMNLCTNALHAMKNGGVLEVSLDRAQVAQNRRLSRGDLAPGAYVLLCVSDTGSGIPPQVLDRMFDPFFTTKQAGEGTGLGLSLVHGIVADLGGTIDVDTTVGRGTTFTIWLPLAGETTVPPAKVATLPRGHGQTVMIVDDEKALVALTEEMLAKLGYEPIGFTSSVAALDAFREAPQRFDIVLTDETMPELIGTDLAREIRLLRPDIPIVSMSGYSGAPLDERARAVGIREVLRKPLQSNDIAECFERVLR